MARAYRGSFYPVRVTRRSPMTTIAAIDVAGRPRSPATFPGYLAGRSPRNKGRRYPADPPRVEEIVAVMRHAGNRAAGARLRGLVVVLWRAGLRINEALMLVEADLEPGAVRCWSATARAESAARLGWTIGAGSIFGPGSSAGWSFRSDRCSA